MKTTSPSQTLQSIIMKLLYSERSSDSVPRKITRVAKFILDDETRWQTCKNKIYDLNHLHKLFRAISEKYQSEKRVVKTSVSSFDGTSASNFTCNHGCFSKIHPAIIFSKPAGYACRFCRLIRSIDPRMVRGAGSRRAPMSAKPLSGSSVITGSADCEYLAVHYVAVLR